MYLRNILYCALQGRVVRLKEVVEVILNNDFGGSQLTVVGPGIVDGSTTILLSSEGPQATTRMARLLAILK